MSQTVYRIIVVGRNGDLHQHFNARGVGVYTSLASARGAITWQKNRRARYRRDVTDDTDYRIESMTGEWMTVE